MAKPKSSKKTTVKTKPQAKVLKDGELDKVTGGSFSWGISNSAKR